MNKSYNRKLILEDGREYYGYCFGAEVDRVSELVFNTSMMSYQEIISDPSYRGQAVVMTYPVIGSYGINDEDFASDNVCADALIVGEYNDEPSNWRSEKTLSTIMKENGVAGIYGIDTRELVRSIRDKGTVRCLITSDSVSKEDGLCVIALAPMCYNQAQQASRSEVVKYPVENARLRAVVIDCGMKNSIVKSLNSLGVSVTVVPYATSIEKIKSFSPNGIIISDGPGNPSCCKEVIETVKSIKGVIPILGIGIGMDMIALAYGGATYKLKAGHHGSNIPVMDTVTGKVEVISCSNMYAIREESIMSTALCVTHKNVLGGDVAAVECKKDRAYGMQYYPKDTHGTQTAARLFGEFIKAMEENKNA